jgi:RNA polymerase sigma-70 factor (ECF subfamily)
VTPEEFQLAQRLDRFRDYLQVLARLHLGARLRRRIGLSDVVQQTLLQACRHLEQFRGQSDEELAAWLRQILCNILNNAYRDQAAGKRDIQREQSLEASLNASSARLGRFLAANQSSPSQQAEHNDRKLRLAAALEALPESQRDAVTLHYLGGQTVNAIAEQMGKTPTAVAGLIKRGMRQLRQQMPE